MARKSELELQADALLAAADAAEGKPTKRSAKKAVAEAAADKFVEMLKGVA